MRTLRRSLCTLLCALTLLALPRAARAAPMITLSPAAAPAGQPVALAGVGFPANAALVFSVRDQTGAVVDDPTARGTIAVGADGTFRATITPSAAAPPGRYDVIVATATTTAELARASLTLTSPRGEVLAVAPSAGASGTLFVVTGTGFEANIRLLVAAFPGNTRTPAGPPVPVTVGADGRLRATIASAGYAPGVYQAIATRGQNDPILATTIFTVTAPVSMPGLPNTGGGGASATAGTSLFTVLLLGALLALGAIALRRRPGSA